MKRKTPKPRNSNPQKQFEKVEYTVLPAQTAKKYVGQTGRSFNQRYKEHVHDFKFNTRKFSFATHLLENNHSMGPINEIMTVLFTTKKGKFMDTAEKFHIYKETRNSN